MTKVEQADYIHKVYITLAEVVSKLNALLKMHNESTAGNLEENYQILIGEILSTTESYTVELNSIKDEALKAFQKASKETL